MIYVEASKCGVSVVSLVLQRQSWIQPLTAQKFVLGTGRGALH